MILKTGLVVPALENGSLNRSAVILMQAGFTSRQAAIKAVNDSAATFTNAFALNQWLNSEFITEQTKSGIWPTPENSANVEDFHRRIQSIRDKDMETSKKSYTSDLEFVSS